VEELVVVQPRHRAVGQALVAAELVAQVVEEVVRRRLLRWRISVHRATGCPFDVPGAALRDSLAGRRA
jgi:hypothetical protein